MPLRPRYRARLMLMDDTNFRTAIMKVVRGLEAMVLALFIALLFGAYAMWPVITGRAARTTYVNDQIRSIWCALVQNVPDTNPDPRIKQVRKEFHCPAFDPKKVPHPATRTITHTPTPTKKPSAPPGAAGKPTPTPAPRETPASSPRAKRTPGTVTHSVTITRGVTVTPTQSGQVPFPVTCPLPPLLCIPIDKLPI